MNPQLDEEFQLAGKCLEEAALVLVTGSGFCLAAPPKTPVLLVLILELKGVFSSAEVGFFSPYCGRKKPRLVNLFAAVTAVAPPAVQHNTWTCFVFISESLRPEKYYV